MSPSLSRRAASCLLLAALLAACDRTPASSRDPESAANAFFAALESGDPHAAYDGSAFGFQAAQSFDRFLSNARDLGLIGGQPPTWTSNVIQDTEAHFDGSLVNSVGNPVNISLVMTQDGGAWKVFTLKTSFGSGLAENPFTVVGKDTGFNDVYSQPMPRPNELNDLVRDSMSSFATAVKTGDFHAFYLSVADEWKNGRRPSGAITSDVTEKMLKDHFQGFISTKDDITSVASLNPVFDLPPQFNDVGVLELRGHFDTKPYRLNFNLQYIFEFPAWKLFGITVSLTN